MTKFKEFYSRMVLGKPVIKYTVGIISFIILTALLTLLLFRSTIFRSPQNLSGDEPHYLIIADSLIRDKDIDVKNDYTLERYSYFYAPPIDPHVNVAQFKPGSPRWYSIHFPGMGAMAWPFLFWGGVKSVIYLMTALAALLLVLSYFWIKKVTGSKTVSLLVTFLFSITTFYLGMVGRIFPDIPIALIVLAGVIILEKENRNKFDYLLLGILTGLAFWMHVKSILYISTIDLIAFVQLVKSSAPKKDKLINSLFLCLPVLFVVGIFEFKLHQWYGFWMPNKVYSGNNQLLQISPLNSFAATLFDSVKGVLINNPMIFLVFFGVPIWFTKNKSQLLRLCAIILPTVLVQGTFSDWFGGWSPTGRYPLEIFPILLPAIGLAILYAKKFTKPIVALILIAHLCLGLVYLKTFRSINWAYEQNVVYERISNKFDVNIPGLFPQFSLQGANVSEKDKGKLVLLLCIGVGLVGSGAYSSTLLRTRRGKKDVKLFEK